MEQIEQVEESSVVTPKSGFNLPNIDPRSNIKGFLVFIFALIILGAGAIGIASRSFEKTKEPQPSPKPSDTFSSISPHVLVYGFWTDSNSQINAYDLENQKEYILASLPKNIKKISIFSSNELLYINNLNDKDNGEEVTIYSIKEKTTKTLYKAEKGYGIDDYSISPDKHYLASWEVSFAKDSALLRDGRSRIYGINLSSPSVKYLIFDESANAPIHYPRGVTDTGKIIADTFLPNSGLAGAYGVSVSSVDGTNKKDLDNMQNGTYSTQLYLSPDGRFLTFAGYDESRGDGREFENGTKRALLYPNTIELLDTASYDRIKLLSVLNKDLYPFVSWDKEKNEPFFIKASNNIGEYYWYDMAAKTAQKIPIGKAEINRDIFISSLAEDKILVGKKERSLITMGRLGESYNLPFKSFSVVNARSSSVIPLQLKEGAMQFISLVSSSVFENTLASLSDVSSTQKSLQLDTLSYEPSIAPKRLSQQSSLPCFFTRSSQNLSSPCAAAVVVEGLESLYDPPEITHPLYIYGPKGLKVSIKIGIPIFGSDPVYVDGYNILLQDGGEMQANGKIYERIKFNYKPAIKVIPLGNGKIASRGNLASVLFDYARRLGLNEKETNDLIESSKGIKSPYVFVSFFDQKTSKAMLPVYFDPSPDTYINIVFYFKALQKMPKVLPPAPKFEPIIQRGAFTAVEIGSLIDN